MLMRNMEIKKTLVSLHFYKGMTEKKHRVRAVKLDWLVHVLYYSHLVFIFCFVFSFFWVGNLTVSSTGACTVIIKAQTKADMDKVFYQQHLL